MSILQELGQFIQDEDDIEELNLIIDIAKRLKNSGMSMDDIEEKLSTRFGGEYLYEPREGEEFSIIEKVRKALGE